MTPKELNEVLSLKETKATKQAKSQLFGEKSISDDEKELNSELQEERKSFEPEDQNPIEKEE